jgi:hypothetical protein
MGGSTVASPPPVKEKSMPATATAPARVPVRTPSPSVWTISRTVVLAPLVAIPLVVVSLRPSPRFVLSAIAAQLVFCGLSVKAWLSDQSSNDKCQRS